MDESRKYRVSTVGELKEALNERSGAAVGTEIVLEQGDYFLDGTLELNESHSHITLRGEGKVRLIGGVRLTGWRPVNDTDVLRRLAPEAAAHILVCDLAEHGLTDLEGFVSRGFGRDPAPSHPEPFWNGRPLYVAQYPKRGEFLTITGFAKGDMNELEEQAGIPEYGFYFSDLRPASWEDNDDLWVHGYWSFDWKPSYERVKSIDHAAGHLLTHAPYAVSPFRPGQRFYFLNVLEELRYPGDYFLDRKANKLYFYPDSRAADGNDELLLSLLKTPLLRLSGSRHITLRGLVFECGRGDGLAAKDASGLTIDRCTFRHLGNSAVRIEGGVRNSVRNSTIHHVGEAGIHAAGGDRATLEPAEFSILNNHIYRIAQWNRCYEPAIHIRGVGIRAAHNLIHDLPHIGILWWGNDIEIEHNEIYSVCMETGDAGAIYSGRDLTFRGNKVRHNFIHHLGGVGLGTMGIYNDDGLSGTVMEDNFFLEVGRACMLGGGVDYAVRNNVFVKCYPAVTMDSRVAHTKFFWGAAYPTLKTRFYEAAADLAARNPYGPDSPKIDASKSPYIDRYPELLDIDKMFRENRPMTASALIERNVFCNKTRFRYFYDLRDENKKVMYDDGERFEPTGEELSVILDSRQDFRFEWSAGKGSWRFEKNYTAQPSDFEDAKWGNIAVREGSEAYDYGYERRELATIGLIESERDDVPATVRTCLTYPYRGAERPLTLGIRNDGAKAAEGAIRLYTSANVSLKVTEVPFALAPGEERHVVVGTLPADGERFTVEARSDLPGVRPSRA